MIKQGKIWYSIFGGKSQDSDEGFYEASNFPWAAVLEENFALIRTEIEEYIQKKEHLIGPYFNSGLVDKKNHWKTSSFIVWGWKVKKNMMHCAGTMELLGKIPGIVSASISILEPHTTIKPHRGDTNAIVRVHIPVFVPAGLPDCGFRVIETDKAWKEGKVLIFNDAAWHKAWNYTGERRYILLVDVMKKEFESKKYRVCSMVLAGLVMQLYSDKIPFFTKLPKVILLPTLFSHVAAINMVLQIRRMLGF